VIGINTRPVVNSFVSGRHTVYSVSFYNVEDNRAHYKKSIISGNYNLKIDNYNEDKLLQLSEEYVDAVDAVVICSGLFENEKSKTPDWNTIGNPPKVIKRINNKKYTIGKLERLGIPVPITYIAYNHQSAEKYIHSLERAILKPIYGSGGKGIIYMDEYSINIDILKKITYPILVQEYIPSESYSATLLNSYFICFNKQLIKNNGYVGNITPYNLNSGNYKNYSFADGCFGGMDNKNMENNIIKNANNININKINIKNIKSIKNNDKLIKTKNGKKYNTYIKIDKNNKSINYFNNAKHIKGIFSEIGENFDLKGLNSVDFMIKDNIPYAIEINPRIPGTYETLELSSNCNLANGILKGLKIKPKKTYFKKVVFAKERCIFKNKIINNYNIRDIPKKNTIIEKNEPICTLVGSSIHQIYSAEKILKMVVVKNVINKGRNIYHVGKSIGSTGFT